MSLSLCLGLVTFMAAELGLARSTDKHDPENTPLELVFQAGHMDASHAFTRQANGGELEVSDPDARPGGKTFALTSIVAQSLLHSSNVPIRHQQQTAVAVPCGSRTLLYRRLII